MDKEWKRDKLWVDGYNAAWSDAVAWLHRQADGFRDPDPRARQIANSLAFQLGNFRKSKTNIER